MTFYQAQPHEQLSLVKRLTAETKTEEFVAGQGVRVKWERLREAEPLVRCAVQRGVLGLLGWSKVGRRVQAEAERIAIVAIHGWEAPDGRPWIDAEGWKENQERWFGR